MTPEEALERVLSGNPKSGQQVGPTTQIPFHSAEAFLRAFIEEHVKPARGIEAWVEPDELYDPCPVGWIECYLEDPGDGAVRVEIHIPEPTDKEQD